MMDVADLFTIVYGSLYIVIVLYLSVYCWVKLENELIFSIQKITIEYKKIISVIRSSPRAGRIQFNSIDELSPSCGPLDENTYPFTVSHELQQYIGGSITSVTSVTTQHNPTAGNSFLRPMPEKYYETFIKPFDIYEDEEETIQNMQIIDEEINIAELPEHEDQELAISTTPGNILKITPSNSTTSTRKRGGGDNSENIPSQPREITFAVKFFYWVWVTWNMSSIYGLLIIHIWDLGTDGAVMIKWYTDGVNADPKWKAADGDIDLFSLFVASIFFILLYRIIAAVMIYKLTLSPCRVLSQLLFDSEIFRSILISFKLRLSEPGYIQTWLQKLEATFESLPQAVLQLSYLALLDGDDKDTKLVIISIVLSLMTMAERFERDDKLYFPYSMYYITKETSPYISFPYIVRFCWRLFEVSCRTFVFVLLWITVGRYVLFAIFIIECILIGYGAHHDGKYDFLSYFVGVPLRYLKEKRTWSLTAIRFFEHFLMLVIVWTNTLIDCHCEELLGCYSHEKIRERLWLTPSGDAPFGLVLLLSTSIMTILTPMLYLVIWKWYIVKDVSRLTATQERDIWVVTKTGDIRGLREMIEFGVNPDLRNRNNETLLHVYFREYITYNQEFVNVLSTNNRFYMGALSAPGRQTILHAAVSHATPSRHAIKYLMDHGMLSTDHSIDVNYTDAAGRTALMCYLCPNAIDEQEEEGESACFERDADIEILRLITEWRYGLRPEIRDKNGNCIIHYAAMNPLMSDNNIEYILDIYLNAVNRLYADEMDEIERSGPGVKETQVVNVDTPTDHLYNLTGAEQIQMYKQSHANRSSNKWEYVVGSVDVKNRFHQTPFMFYMAYNLSVSNSMINLFMEHGMDPLLRDGFRNSIFHWAVKNIAINQQNGLDALRFICQQLESKHFGSLMETFEVNAKKESIFHTYFAENESFSCDIVNLFLDYKVDINTIDLKGNTCLHYAAANIHLSCESFVWLMTKMNIAHCETKNSEKQTPFDVYKSVRGIQEYTNLVHKIKEHPQLKLNVNVEIMAS